MVHLFKKLLCVMKISKELSMIKVKCLRHVRKERT